MGDQERRPEGRYGHRERWPSGAHSQSPHATDACRYSRLTDDSTSPRDGMTQNTNKQRLRRE
eukprot:4311663-Prymnesium_polylepis.2